MANVRSLTLPLALGVALGTAASGQSRGPCAANPIEDAQASRLQTGWSASALTTVPAGRLAVLKKGPQNDLDLGLAPAGARLDRMLILLAPSAAQDRALDAELRDQQAPGTCEYHHWLTPQQFADAYSNSPADVTAIAAWLASLGFDVAPLPSSRGWIEFSGTVRQVEQAFQTSVHAFAASGATRYALSDAINVPGPLSAMVRGMVSLDGVVSSPALTTLQPVLASPAALAAEASMKQAEALTPRLVSELLHLDALYSAGTTGAGESIAIAARSSIQSSDIDAFRSAFELPASPVKIVPNGADPGFTGDQAEAELAASWAGAAAPGAQIIVVPARNTTATDGVDLSLAAIVDQRMASTVVVDFSACESVLSDAHRAFYAALYRQAAAEGTAVVAASGDSGAAACHAAGGASEVSTGFAVNALASTPWNTAVGAAAFATSNGDLAAWSPVNRGDPAYAGGGGASATHAAPAWQPAMSATETHRMLPDLALPAGVDTAFSRGLAFCFSGSSPSAGCNLVRSGGTSAAAAIFGGISALVAQKYGPQGNLAPNLYALSRQSGIFNDVQQGSTRLPCAPGTPDCDATGQIGYEAKAGYDPATGLGSPDAQALVNSWASPQAAGTGADTVTLSASPGQANATYNPSASITFTAAVASGTGGAMPTGTVNFNNQTTGNNLNGSPYSLDSSGTASITVIGALPTGGNNIVAQYSGDATYATRNSQPLTINIQPSSTTTTVTPSTTTPTTGTPLTVAVTIAAGSPPAGTAAPTGKVNLTLDGTTYATATVATAAGTTSASFNVTVSSAGTHNLQAIYAGDPNYATSTSAPVSVNASKGATVTTLTATPAAPSPGTPESFTATIAASSPAAGVTDTFTGTVTFFDGNSQLGSVTVASNAATLSGVTLTGSAAHVITAVYSGDGNWGGSTSNAITLQAVLYPVTVALTASPVTAGPGQVVTLVATVTPQGQPAAGAEQNPTGKIVFYNGTTIIGTVALSAGPNNTSVAQLLLASLPAGQDTLTAAYVGDSFYAAATSNAVTVTIQDFTLTPGASNPPADLDIVKGQAGTASFIVTGLGGFNNLISVVCTVPAQDDMTCAASPQQITPTGTVTFTITTYLTGGTTAHNRVPLWPGAAGGTAFAVLLFLFLPGGRRVRVFTDRGRQVLILILLLAALGAAGMGCSSVSGTVADPASGTPLGEATVTITAATNIDNTVVSHSAYLLVNVLPPGATGTSVPAGPAR